jgi:hypothetical protein
MATQQVNGSATTPSSTQNNSGTVLNGGSTQVLSSVNLGYSDVGVFGSSVVDGNETDKVLNAGTFSYNNQKPVAKRVTKELSGVANTYLQSGAAVPGNIRSIHKLEVLRTLKQTTAIRAGYFDIYSGKFTTPPNNVVDTLATDDAASPSREVPGELQYKTGAPVPVQDNYKVKTN